MIMIDRTIRIRVVNDRGVREQWSRKVKKRRTKCFRWEVDEKLHVGGQKQQLTPALRVLRVADEKNVKGKVK